MTDDEIEVSQGTNSSVVKSPEFHCSLASVYRPVRLSRGLGMGR